MLSAAVLAASLPARGIGDRSPSNVARVLTSGAATPGKFPEYDEVWRDGSLNVVAVFGKADQQATSAAADAGIASYNAYVAEVKALLANFQPVTIPAVVPTSPGVATSDIEFRASLSGGRKIRVNALLVDNLPTAPKAFNDRYGQLSTRADLITYVGRFDSGEPARVLLERGRFVSGQYAIALVNCCNAYGNLRATIAETRSGLNAGDPKGTRYLDVVTNAGAHFFVYGRLAAQALVRGLLNRDVPASYDKILDSATRPQDWLVTGEEDNVYRPPIFPGGATNPVPWDGIDETGTVTKSEERRLQTETLDAGSYLISLTGTGDADLYVRIGSPPSTTTYDCRPFKTGSTEGCVVTLGAPASLHIMVRGYAPSSTYRLIGQPQ